MAKQKRASGHFVRSKKSDLGVRLGRGSVRIGGVVSRLGGSVLSDWGGSVTIGGKCQDCGAPVGGMLSGLGVYCQD